MMALLYTGNCIKIPSGDTFLMLTQFKLALLCFVFERTDDLMSELCAKVTVLF